MDKRDVQGLVKLALFSAVAGVLFVWAWDKVAKG